MGYHTEFDGTISITPALNETEVKYLKQLNGTRRMHRGNGAYYVGDTENFGQNGGPDVIDSNKPDPSQPSLWCNWTVSDDGTELMWDGGEKAYAMAEWLDYILKHFIGQDPIAKKDNPHFDFLQPHTFSGVVKAEGEEQGDLWEMGVINDVACERMTNRDANATWHPVNWKGEIVPRELTKVLVSGMLDK